MDKKHRKVLIRIILTIALFIMAVVLEKIVPNYLNICLYKFISVKLIIYVLIYTIIGYDILYKAIRNILTGRLLDENFLMTIASVSAFFVSEYSEAITVMLLYQIGELFQKIAVDKSRKSIADLIDICPEYANVLDSIDSSEPKLVDSDEVSIGSIIMIKVGERVPIDCKVIKGETLIDTSALTGESVPVTVRPGDEILSGSINSSNVIIAETICEFEDSTATKILDLVENASDKKSKSENFITKFAKYYTPIVVGMAVILAFVPTLLFGGQWSTWIDRACIFLITSCPCALVISIPLTFFGGIGKASKKGILVKGSNYLEELAKVNTMVFDKTGTLTKGNFKVGQLNTVNCSKSELINMCYVAERHSNHPIANAIVSYYNSNNVNINNSNEFLDKEWNIEEVAGKGMVATCDNDCIYVGNAKLMDNYNIEGFSECLEVGTVVYIAYNNIYKGYILINDEVKDNSKLLIETLNKIGITENIMLTGDRKEIGESIGIKLGLSEVYAELFPADKVNKLEEIIDNSKAKSTVAYIGDGINDAPVLARADIGISMGGVSSDVAIEASDIVLMDDNLLKIVDAIKLARVTMKVVKQNIVFALGVKFIVLILGVVGFANMWLAIFADVGVMVLAILNAILGINIKDKNL